MKKNKLLLVLLWIFNWNHIYSLYTPSNNFSIDNKKTNITKEQDINKKNIKSNDDNENFNEQGGPSLTLDLKQDESKDKKDKKDNFSVLLGGLALIVVGFLIWRFGIRNTITIDTSKNLEPSFLNKINIDPINSHQEAEIRSIFNSIQTNIESIKNSLNNKEINKYLDAIYSHGTLNILLPDQNFYNEFHYKKLKELYNETENEYNPQKKKDKKFLAIFLEKLTTFNQQHNNIYSISQGTDHILLSKDNCNLKFFDRTALWSNAYNIEIQYYINPIYYVNIKIFFSSSNRITIDFKFDNFIKNNLSDNLLLNLSIEDIFDSREFIPNISLLHYSYEKKRQCSSNIKINNEIKLMILNFFNIEIKDVAETNEIKEIDDTAETND